MTTRFPAEWEDQDGVLMAWPHTGSDWLPHLDLVESVFTEIAGHISRFESVLITAADPDHVRTRLQSAGAVMERVMLYPIDSNDTWARDFGPVTVEVDGLPLLIDFAFNGWGLRFASNLDNLITRHLNAVGAFSAPLRRVGLVLEGGSIESDGNGTILTTSQCLLSDNRNPHLSRSEIETELAGTLGAERILWLEKGYLAGDDTDSHVDTLARLCPNDTIVHVACNDMADEHFPAISAMVEELRKFRTKEGVPYKLIPLPWPKARFGDDGHRLPATYANFLVINDAVLVPTYDDTGDDAALHAVATAFPDRRTIGVNCLPLILQHGSLHCVTMQLPKGTLNPASKGDLW